MAVWSRDGRRLMAATADGELYFADVADSVGPPVDSGLGPADSRQGLPEEGR